VLLHEIVTHSARQFADKTALRVARTTHSYRDLAEAIESVARGLHQLDVRRYDRVAVYLPKTFEGVAAMFGTAAAGGVFVPVNPVLKAPQVRHILQDSGARILITSKSRFESLGEVLSGCTALSAVVFTESETESNIGGSPRLLSWRRFMESTGSRPSYCTIDADVVAILYTSGSTGLPKGVVLSHRNMVAGAISVAAYLQNDAQDRILAVLPLSFDAGFSQLTTGFLVGAEVVLADYYLARDAVKIAADAGVTGITGVPPLWAQLADAQWPEPARRSIRYFATTGGVMPKALLDRLRALFPEAKPYLMYGLTEAFRSTYLPPEQVDQRPGSIGRAIPNAEILVVREDGSVCDPGEPGELVHRGALVSLGYWNAPELTAERFRPIAGSLSPGGRPEMAVWSGDTVIMDEEGFLFYKGRRDEMIKTSGYRVSPTEVENIVMASQLTREVVAVGIPDDRLGQSIVVVAVPVDAAVQVDAVVGYCQKNLPTYMVPRKVIFKTSLPRNPNGKFDRVALRQEFSEQPTGRAT
jgi:acyl-CoA ligase (AMP-forming) (exosortase A-associated)